MHDILAAYRRVCVLRCQKRNDEAETLHRDVVAPAIAALRDEGEYDADSFEAALEHEKRRVEDAALVAELILPFLTGAAPVSAFSSVEPSGKNSPTVPRAKPAAGNVAAFIDDMLAQSAPSTRR